MAADTGLSKNDTQFIVSYWHKTPENSCKHNQCGYVAFNAGNFAMNFKCTKWYGNIDWTNPT